MQVQVLGFEPTTEQDSGQPGAGNTPELADALGEAWIIEGREKRKFKERKGTKAPMAVLIVKERA